MEALTRALAVELAPVRVNAVSPGLVRTPLWGNVPETEREALFREAGRRLPVGRVGEPREIAETYPVSDAERIQHRADRDRGWGRGAGLTATAKAATAAIERTTG
jgi:NAD(P)-dependent dehydrogenase (short-subunit alcohol dehydrogenase family)